MEKQKKYVGIVKWFHDQIKDSYYGFINHHELGELYFNERSIDRLPHIDPKAPKVEGPKVLGKINLEELNLASHPRKKFLIKIHRLGEAIKEFNIGRDTLIEFLIEKGFEIKDPNSGTKLTEQMYNALQVEFGADKAAKLARENISLPGEELRERLKNHFGSDRLFLNLFHEDTVVTFNLKENSFEKELKSVNLKELPAIYEYLTSSNEKRLEATNVNLLSNESDLFFLFEAFVILTFDFKKSGEIPKYAIKRKGIEAILDSLKKQLDLVCTEYNDSQTKRQLFELFKNYFSKIFQSEPNDKFLKEVLGIGKVYCNEYYEEIMRIAELNLSQEIMYKLWLEEYSNILPIDFIAKEIFETEASEITKIFDRCSDEEKRNIFYKLIFNIEFNPEELHEIQILNFGKIKKLLNLAKEYALGDYEKISTSAINICPDYFKLDLWLEDYPVVLDFDIFKLYIITLSPKNQKKFIKKVLKNIHEGRINIKCEDFTSINTIDYETSMLAAKIDNSHLDYSTSIILNVITELQQQATIDARKAQSKIYDLIIKKIKEPNDILQITGYFDECAGRCRVSINEEKNDLDELIKIPAYIRGEKARRHPICDGRKAINRQTNQPALSEDNQMEYWWCANQKCYQPSRVLHSSDDWENYTLFDFLTILKVDFKEQDLEIYLNLINKANHFLAHLKCRKCNQILRPIGQANYAFYGVTRFSCSNDLCDEKGKEIYLNHCLNGYCEQAIDSRDSVKCKPTGQDEKCGWYICNNCFACCSNEGIGRRKYILEKTGQEYKCHTNGHRDLGILCCNKCGNPMVQREIDRQKYQQTLDWFVDNIGQNHHIIRSGQNHGKWWFLFDQNNLTIEQFGKKIHNLFSLGFRIPDFGISKSTYLICEPNDVRAMNEEIFLCNSCNNVIDLSNDYERLLAVKKYHKQYFATIQ